MGFPKLASLAFIFFILTFIQCGTAKKTMNSDLDLMLFASMLEGSYSSATQARGDKDYLNINLEMKRIWTNRSDGYWFYVEQALANSLEKPYRQRVYQIIKRGEHVVSKIYQFNDPLNYAGAHSDTSKLNKLTFDKLSTKEGCDVFMKKNGSIFEGGTIGKNCASSLKGSVYASSEIVLSSSSLKSWDKGFDGDDVQVWGPTKGAYNFIKLQPATIEERSSTPTNSN